MIRATTRVAGVIGDPVRHSLSPLLHNAAYRELALDWVYVAFDVPRGSTRAALDGARTLGLVGLSVTMPHKEAAAEVCDDLSDQAAALHSVNTVTVHADGRLRGDSTDGEGFVRALRAAGHDPGGIDALVLGAGGAARAVALALVRSGASVTIAARRPDAARAAAGIAGTEVVPWGDRDAAAKAAALVVNATPVGMAGDDTVVVRTAPGTVVADLVYHPLDTPLLRSARDAGARTVDGLGMLVHQAALQVELWSGRVAPVDVMTAAAVAAVAR